MINVAEVFVYLLNLFLILKNFLILMILISRVNGLFFIFIVYYEVLILLFLELCIIYFKMIIINYGYIYFIVFVVYSNLGILVFGDLNYFVLGNLCFFFKLKKFVFLLIRGNNIFD